MQPPASCGLSIFRCIHLEYSTAFSVWWLHILLLNTSKPNLNCFRIIKRKIFETHQYYYQRTSKFRHKRTYLFTFKKHLMKTDQTAVELN